MAKMIKQMYAFECQVFRSVNHHFERKYLNTFFRTLTHLGGATFTISSMLLLIIITSGSTRLASLASLIALTLSHIPVALMKKFYPRQRPYLVLEQIRVLDNPLKDHSFPSGHTTAIFSILVPFIMLVPTLAIVLLPVGLIVGVSRIYLGLHYPSDVLVGCFLGSGIGALTFLVLEHYFPYVFV